MRVIVLLLCCDIVTVSSHILTRTHTHTQTAPRPPSDIKVTDITHNAASLTWTVPDFENASTINYVIQVTTSGSGDKVLTQDGHSTSLSLANLDPETMYAVAIQVIDTVTNTEGVFGPAESFSTKSGTPSAPVNLEVSWSPKQEKLSASWSVPNVRNGTIRGYEILYSGLTEAGDGENCDDPGGSVVRNASLQSTQRSFETTSPANIIDTGSKSIFVCVRARTDQSGAWAPFIIKDVDIGAVSGTDTTTEEANCNGLIAVAVVAALAVLSTFVAAVVLCVVVRRHNNQVMDHKSSQSGLSCEDRIGSNQRHSPSPSRDSNDTGFDERPTYQTQQSTMSSYSTGSTTLKPLIPNNSNGRV